MGCPESVVIGEWLVFSVCTHDPTTGLLTDADLNPSYRIYEDETETPILTGTMTKLMDTGEAGTYTELIACTAANGFEAGKCYTVLVGATVNGNTGGTALAFLGAEEEAREGLKKVTVNFGGKEAGKEMEGAGPAASLKDP
jgi:hypothetical protein